jgi:shikimate dehydrogenase
MMTGDPMTDAYAVFGNPIAHSQSPRIHQAFAAQTGEAINYTRQLVELGEFSKAASAFIAAGARGLNITLPFKLDAYSFADQLSRDARQAGAVNTLVVQADGSVLGDNTDGLGLLRDIRDNLGWSITGKRLLLLGAGGAVRGALGPLLAEQPAQLVIANRTAEKAQQLATAFGQYGRVRGCGYTALDDSAYDLVINGTSASLAGEIPALPASLLAPGAVCYDMMYAAQATIFMRWAAERGARASADGLGMLVEQAAQSFFLWRQRRPQTKPVIALLRGELLAR